MKQYLNSILLITCIVITTFLAFDIYYIETTQPKILPLSFLGILIAMFIYLLRVEYYWLKK